ncbi:hypothetical protein AVEN_40483-1 [Araneus ventricosus]|uniref:DDE-1 domain-containing protein n=1 Tax=Araneus ventricosus TaxID=182803 RepID=A0A4Y2LWB8_ARAVE|nr:hypothetical protein AVEN_40483-1 [Araneus ventricosus]
MQKIPEILQEFSPQNIFNADETGLFFKCLPIKTLAFKGDKCFRGEKSKQRITVLLYANMTGEEKLKMLVTGKIQENIDLRKPIGELYKVLKFDVTAKTIRNCLKKGGFSNQADDIDSDDEDVILADLKNKCKAVGENGRITDDATLSDILEVDAELLIASYPIVEEILNSLLDNNKARKVIVILKMKT